MRPLRQWYTKTMRCNRRRKIQALTTESQNYARRSPLLPHNHTHTCIQVELTAGYYRARNLVDSKCTSEEKLRTILSYFRCVLRTRVPRVVVSAVRYALWYFDALDICCILWIGSIPYYLSRTLSMDDAFIGGVYKIQRILF